jgi:hypothetical protein
MFFKKAEKRTHPYVKMTIAALTTIGAVRVVKCVKRAARCMRSKMSVAIRGSGNGIDSMT